MTEPANHTTAVRVLALAYFCGATPRMFEALLRRFGTLDAIFAAGPASLTDIEGLPGKQADRLTNIAERLAEAEAMVQALAARDITLVTRFDDAYGHLLFELNNPPALLFVRGRIPDPARRSVAVVGTGAATTPGIELTSRLVKELVRQDVQIISSLRGGIDNAVHLAARSVGGGSFAVIDRGFDKVDQTEGIPVAIDIIQAGGVISEYAPDVDTRPTRLSESNRLIVGLAQAVVVTEVYSESERTLDLLRACSEIGKLAFLLVDPLHGALADAGSLVKAHECGVIPIEGLDKVGDIVKSLV
jgi:DNA processing protein